MKNKKLQLIAKNVIQDEINALKKIKSSIGNSFNEIVKTILNRKNRDINSIKLGTILVLSVSFLLTQFFDRALYFWYYFGGYLLISTFVPLLCSLFNIKIFRVTKMMLISILLTLIWEFMIFYNISNLPSVYIGLSFSFLWVLMPKLKSYAF